MSAHSRDITATAGPKPVDFPLLSLQGPREKEQEPVGPVAWSEDQVFLQRGWWLKRR